MRIHSASSGRRDRRDVLGMRASVEFRDKRENRGCVMSRLFVRLGVMAVLLVVAVAGGLVTPGLAHALMPALTTVSQNIYRMGEMSVLQAIEHVKGNPVKSAQLETKLEIRRSCGCEPDTFSKSFHRTNPASFRSTLHCGVFNGT